MIYYYDATTGQILVKMPSTGSSQRTDPYIDTEQVILDSELDQWQVNTETEQLETKD
jgi:hypothetical protein